MRWNCPHCEVSLKTSEESMASGWAFSRCYNCRGFALIRRTEVSVVPINGAPPDALFGTSSGEAVADRSRKMTAAAKSVSTRKTQTRALADSIVAGDLPAPLPDLPAPRSFREKILPFMLALLAISGFGSGLYFHLLNQNLPVQPVPGQQAVAAAKALAQVESPVESDQVRYVAMAPVRPAARPLADGKSEISQSEPSPSEPSPSAPAKSLLVQARNGTATLRAGPGHEFPVVALADPAIRYQVSDWSDRWFKVVESPGAKPAWIRNDLVSLVPNE